MTRAQEGWSKRVEEPKAKRATGREKISSWQEGLIQVEEIVGGAGDVFENRLA